MTTIYKKSFWVAVLIFISLALSFANHSIAAPGGDPTDPGPGAYELNYNGNNVSPTHQGGGGNIIIDVGGLVVSPGPPDGAAIIDGLQIVNESGCETGCAVWQDSGGNLYYSVDCGQGCGGGGVLEGGPTADIKANGSNGPINVTSGETVEITWVSTNVTDCTVSPGGWTGTSGGETTGPLASNQTYHLSCSGPNGNASDNVTINIVATPLWYCKASTRTCLQSNLTNRAICETVISFPPYSASPQMCYMTQAACQIACNGIFPPVADIKANNSDGPINIAPYDPVNISWWSTNTTSCTVGPSWAGWTGTSGSHDAGALGGPYTYVFTVDCTGPDGSASDNVTVNVGSAPVNYTLTASVNAGTGTISGPGISCPGDCTETYPDGTWVSLIATPGSSYNFGSWDSACAGQGSGGCSVQMNGDKNAGVNFTAASLPTITASPSSILVGQTDTATWTNSAAAADWIGLYTAGTVSDSNYVDWVYTSCSKSVGGLAVNGSCPFVMNFAGTYEYRLFSNNGLTKLATSNTFTVTSAPAFNYSLSNSGTSYVTKTSGNAFTQNTIAKNYLTGTTQSVTITATGMPAGVSASYDGNRACSPSCYSAITLTVAPSTLAGTYPITVTGVPLNRQTTFNLVISGNPMTLSCAAYPNKALIGENITWAAHVSGGTAPYTYSWTGTNIPTSPAPPSTNPLIMSYNTIGQKIAIVTVTDADSQVVTCDGLGGNPGPASAYVNFDPDLEEF